MKPKLLVLNTLCSIQLRSLCISSRRISPIFFHSTSGLPGFLLQTEDCTQYIYARDAVKHLINRYRWKEDDVYVWVDFSCIPKKDRGTQMLATSTLPLYACLADQCVIVAPCVQHQDTGDPVGPESYRQRMWCGAEQLCHYNRYGSSQMWLCSKCPEDASIALNRLKGRCEPENLAIFGGQCSCYRLQHKHVERCDKAFLVKPVLGLITQLFFQKDRRNRSRGL